MIEAILDAILIVLSILGIVAFIGLIQDNPTSRHFKGKK